MKKIFNILCRVLLLLIMLMPILGTLGIFPEPTRELYNTDQSFAFIQMLGETKYIMIIMSFVFAAAIALTIMNRMAFVALLILPITVNIVSFHWFLDGGPFTAGAVLGNLLLLLNIYFLWQHKKTYLALLKKA